MPENRNTVPTIKYSQRALKRIFIADDLSAASQDLTFQSEELQGTPLFLLKHLSATEHKGGEKRQFRSHQRKLYKWADTDNHR